MDVDVDVVRQEIRFLHDAFPRGEGGSKILREAISLRCEQLALKPVHYLFGLHGITELHRRLELMRATVTLEGPKVIT
jgi:hypothetical protein